MNISRSLKFKIIMANKRLYSVARLLNKQPATIKKQKDYKNLVMQYNYSNLLKKIKFKRKLYSLLNKAKIKPKYLSFVLSKYNIPQHSFFPQFLRMKKIYLERLQQKRREKEQFILEQLKKLPNNIKRLQKKLLEIEKSSHTRSHFPIWTKAFYPKTKKRLFILQKKNKVEWVITFYDFLDKLQEEYGRNKYIKDGYKSISLFLFNLNLPITHNMVVRNFRKLSLKLHPDQGGKDLYFNTLSRAKEILVNALM